MSNAIAPSRTRETTLYRLGTVDPDPESMLDSLGVEDLDARDFEFEVLDIAGQQALWVEGTFASERAEWCDDAARTTGLPINRDSRRGAGLLLVAVDGTVYAIGYGDGHRLIPEDAKDPRFGLRFAVRRLDAQQIRDLVRRTPGAGGRIDSTLVPAGLPIWGFGVEDRADVVGHAAGVADNLPLTYCGGSGREIRVHGAAGLRLRLGVEPQHLVSDIRAIADVLNRERPQPSLEFIERVQPVGDSATSAALDRELDARLGLPADEAARCLTPVVPMTCLDDRAGARSLLVRIGTARPRRVDQPCLEDFLHRTRLQPPGRRLDALRSGTVSLCADAHGVDVIRSTAAVKWLEAAISLESRRFALVDGRWYEIDAEYLTGLQAKIARLLATPPALDLPAWDPSWPERRYNEHVQDVRPGYVCLDRHGARDSLHRRAGVEICDLLGPADELIHVKRAHGSAPLSHLFSQGLVSARTITNSAEARREFSALVRTYGKGRHVPEDFTPKKVVFAILLKDGAPLTPATLFPFSQVTLACTEKSLREDQIPVEVIGIPAIGS